MSLGCIHCCGPRARGIGSRPMLKQWIRVTNHHYYYTIINQSLLEFRNFVITRRVIRIVINYRPILGCDWSQALLLMRGLSTRWAEKSEPQNALHITSLNIGRFKKKSFTVIISRKFAMQLSLNIPPHPKCVATLPCEMFMSENSLLISEIHVIISLHFSFVKKTTQRPQKW